MVFGSENHPWDKSQVEIVLGRTVPGDAAEIKPVYYPGEQRLVSLDLLKFFWGEDVIRQNPEVIDKDQWLDEGESMELPEGQREEAEVGVREQPEDQRRQELFPEPDLDIPILPEDPEVKLLKEKEYMREFKPRFNKKTRRRRWQRK